jgi:hypothetical protein
VFITAVIPYFWWAQPLPLSAFFVFMASVTLEGVLLSGQLRQKLQQRIEPIMYPKNWTGH